ncbi:transcriptional repressor [Synechococcus sp. RSCCF101]|uniref:Fur family transcriptional regulator n=1 Tax=Synechococcus sp. RSCCF101 TaxID=2511069 RepID=UPI001248F281|nr:transcriptional repressor [Synechococcus sp. RSCCF101]QEY31509.1 transcriptional repressor [Synechococcus sp. RSCCF101]
MAISVKQDRILEALERSEDEVSGQALHRALADAGHGMGLATVYRHLRALQQQGRIRCRVLPNGEALYAPVDRDRHHITCVDCGRSEPLAGCPIEEVHLPHAEHQGYRMLFHTLEFYGLCEPCRRRQEQGGGGSAG